MPHHIYETKAFILSSAPSREADRQFVLFTREFGLIRATAQGVREIKSKLRYSLQPFCLSTINLVHGKSGWRVTNARLEENLFSITRGNEVKLKALARVASLLRRLLPSEERHEDYFDALDGGLLFFAHAPETSVPEAELLLVLCTLHHLGYLGASPLISTLLVSGFWNMEALTQVSRMRASLIPMVNESLRGSHL